ncbi:glycerophosphodiester phosphodiesterase [soil metagenome]
MLWPENTSFAFHEAADLGVDLFETDLRVTADGALICFHDATLDRTTDGSGLTARTDLNAIRQLDAGYRHRLAGNFPFRNRGCSVPTLEEIVLRFPTAGFIVDLKAPGTEEPLARLVSDLELHGRVIVGSFSDERLHRFRNLTGHRVPTSTASNETMRAIAAAVAGGRWNPFDRSTVAMQVPISWYGFPVVTRRLVALARRWQRLLHCWTINEPGEMERLFESGVDAVITDRVDLALGASSAT